MAKVLFSSEQQKLTGVPEATFNETDYRSLTEAMIRRFPALDRASLLDMAIAINGEIIHEPLLEKIPPDSDVHFFPFIAGG
ncbi:MAG: MoaD/ThiS family protein [Pseudomonadales bacterium]|nr:MoaD/ThiS family protein [Pseudomonadales bacterium]